MRRSCTEWRAGQCVVPERVVGRGDSPQRGSAGREPAPCGLAGLTRIPGQGLGVRILVSEVPREYAETLRRADAIFIKELYRHDLYDRMSQAFAVFLRVKSVGVQGDARRYEHVIALRAVETVDFMTAHWAHLPYEFLDLCSRKIINEIGVVSRVVHDISRKPPATIEWE